MYIEIMGYYGSPYIAVAKVGAAGTVAADSSNFLVS